MANITAQITLTVPDLSPLSGTHLDNVLAWINTNIKPKVTALTPLLPSGVTASFYVRFYNVTMNGIQTQITVVLSGLPALTGAVLDNIITWINTNVQTNLAALQKTYANANISIVFPDMTP